MRTYTGLCTLGFDGIKARNKAEALRKLKKAIRKAIRKRKGIVLWHTSRKA